MADDLISRAAALRQCYGYAAYAAERIRALPAVAASQSVRVKPLVWEGDGYWCVGDNEGWLEEVNTPFGWGYAIEFSSSKQGSWVASSAFGKTLTGFDSPDAAKAAAQADYEQRILAAVEVQPDPRDALIAGLVEALEREPTLVWIIENTTQVRIRDLAIDMLEQQRAAIATAKGLKNE